MHEIVVNGEAVSFDLDPRTPFLEVLRETIGLKGTKYGCGEGECDACTIIVDGKTICACLALTGSLAGAQVTTVEGMANDPIGTRLINALARKGAVQCGFCTPGIVLSSWELLAHQEKVDTDAVRDALSGNLCRCTGYVKIIEAVTECALDCALSPMASRKAGGPLPVRAGQHYWRPGCLRELLEGYADFSPEARLIAGGTDLMVQFEHRLDELSLVDISGIAELGGISETGTGLRIGALATWSAIRHSSLVAQHAPLLAQAAAEVGGIQIQNRGTIGGNIVNASPAADGLPALYIHGAEVEIASRAGTRRMAIADFVMGPRQTALARGEIVVAVIVPTLTGPGNPVFFFEKVGPRKAQTITKGSVAFHAFRHGDRLVHPKIALGAVGPTVIRAREAEAALAADASEAGIVRASELASAAAKPIDDLRSTADYRRRLVEGLLIRGLTAAQGQGSGAHS